MWSWDLQTIFWIVKSDVTVGLTGLITFIFYFYCFYTLCGLAFNSWNVLWYHIYPTVVCPSGVAVSSCPRWPTVCPMWLTSSSDNTSPVTYWCTILCLTWIVSILCADSHPTAETCYEIHLSNLYSSLSKWCCRKYLSKMADATTHRVATVPLEACRKLRRYLSCGATSNKTTHS